MSGDFAAVTRELVREGREHRKARKRELAQAEAKRKAEELEERGEIAGILQQLASQLLEPETYHTRYRRPTLIVSSRWSFISVSGYTVDYSGVGEERLHVSLSRDVYIGSGSRPQRVDPWKMSLKQLRKIIERLEIASAKT